MSGFTGGFTGGLAADVLDDPELPVAVALPPLLTPRRPSRPRFAIGFGSFSRVPLDLRPRLSFARAQSTDVLSDPPAQLAPDADSSIEMVTVSGRVVTGTDDDDNPTYGWVDLFRGRASIEHTGGVEQADSAGTTRMTGVFVVDNPTGVYVPDTSAVTDADGTVWRVIAARQLSEAVELEVEGTDG